MSYLDPFDEVVQSIGSERARQDDRWGEQDHSYPDWRVILGKELGDSDHIWRDTYYSGRVGLRDSAGPSFRESLVESAAVLCAMIECGDREGWFE